MRRLRPAGTGQALAAGAFSLTRLGTQRLRASDTRATRGNIPIFARRPTVPTRSRVGWCQGTMVTGAKLPLLLDFSRRRLVTSEYGIAVPAADRKSKRLNYS